MKITVMPSPNFTITLREDEASMLKALLTNPPVAPTKAQSAFAAELVRELSAADMILFSRDTSE